MAGCVTLGYLSLLAFCLVGCLGARDTLQLEHQETGSTEATSVRGFDKEEKPNKFQQFWQTNGNTNMVQNMDRVRQLNAASKDFIRHTFATTTQDGSGTDVASLDSHVAVVARVLDKLELPNAHVMDLGCGTGALMAIFLEMASKTCNGCTVEGIEYLPQLRETATERLTFFLEALQDDWDVDMGKVAQGVMDVKEGNAFEWTGAGNKYHVINVGFAVTQDTLGGPIGEGWKEALANGGTLIVPLCTHTELYGTKRCAANYHFVTRTEGEQVPFKDEVLDVQVPFLRVDPA